MDFNYFKKHKYDNLKELMSLEKYDCLITSYVEADRVRKTSQMIPSKEKWWVCGNGVVPKFVKDDRLFHIHEDNDGGIAESVVRGGYKRLWHRLPPSPSPRFPDYNRPEYKTHRKAPPSITPKDGTFPNGCSCGQPKDRQWDPR